MVTIAETGEFLRQANKLLSDEERQELFSFLSANPDAGSIMVGTGGIRKLRWARAGTGKSGGVRVIYFFHNENMPIYLLNIYGKGDKANLSRAERNELAKLVDTIVAYWRNR